MAKMFRLTLNIHGRVQGVFFRQSACEEGRRLGLVGRADNIDDGTVRIIAEGPHDQLNEFKKWCKGGPELAKVEKLEEKMEPIEEFTFKEFSCIFH